MKVEAHDSRLIPEPARAPRFSRLVIAAETGLDAPGCFGRHVPQIQLTPNSVFYDAKRRRGPKHRRATGPGSYSELDIHVGQMLEIEATRADGPILHKTRMGKSLRKLAGQSYEREVYGLT